MSDNPYQLILSDQAKSDFRHLDRTVAQRILDRLQRLAETVEETPHVALKGRLRGAYRLRIGNYRAVYMLEHSKRKVVVLEVGHRSSIYDE